MSSPTRTLPLGGTTEEVHTTDKPDLHHQPQMMAIDLVPVISRHSQPGAKGEEIKTSATPIPTTSQPGSTAPKTSWAMLKGDSWLWESISCLTAVAGMVATVVLLHSYDSKALPSWPLGITLGSLLSIFATVITASISVPLSSGLGQLGWIKFRRQPHPLAHIGNFDAASRSILGGLQLVILRRGDFTACLGVLLLLLAFAIGPFIQLALNFRESTGVALINRCENIISQDNDLIPDGFTSVDLSDNLDTVIQGLVVGNDFDQPPQNNQYIQALKTNCGTGNCIWDTFPSLGYCSDCNNVTQHILSSCSTSPVATDPTLGLGSEIYCNYTLPNGQFISDYIEPIDSNTTSDFPYFSVNYSSDGIYPSSIAYQNWDKGSTFGFFSVLQLIPSTSTVQALECVLYWCVQGVSSQIIKETLYEKIQPQSFYHATPLPANTQDHGSEISISLVPPQSQWPMLGLNTSTNFTIDDVSRIWLESPFYYLLGPKGDNYSFHDNSQNLSPTIFEELASLNIVNWAHFWNKILISLNAVLRANCPLDQAALGLEQNTGLVVDVRWPWLALPASVVLLTAGFLFIVAMYGYVHKVPVWKTNILAHHIHGLPDDVRSFMGQNELQRVSSMEKWAETVVVRLEPEQASLGGAKGHTRWLLRKALPENDEEELLTFSTDGPSDHHTAHGANLMHVSRA